MQFDGRTFILTHLANLKAMYNAPKVGGGKPEKVKKEKGVPYRNEDNNLHRKLVKAAGGIRQYKKYLRNQQA